MKNRPKIEMSDSELSDEVQEERKGSPAKTFKENSYGSDSDENLEFPAAPAQYTSQKKSSKKTVAADPLETYLLQNEGLREVPLASIITKGDDVCLLEIPKTIDPNEFIGKSINYDRKTKLKISNRKYVIEPSTETVKAFSLLTNGLQTILPLANLKVREYIRHKNKSEPVDIGKFKPSVPDNLKVRHPLFGAEFKNKIVLDDAIQQRLNESIDEALRKMKKKKKHKEKYRDREATSPADKSTKKRHKKDELMDPESIFASLEPGSSRKNKSHSHHKSMENEGEPLFEYLQTHDLKKKYSGFEESPSTSDDKKNSSIFNQSESLEFGKKKKKRHKSESDEPNLNVNNDVSLFLATDDEFNVKKKKKRHKSQDNVHEEVSFSSFVQETESEMKKRKSRRDEEARDQTSSLIFDILNKVKSEMDSPVKKKKKKSER